MICLECGSKNVVTNEKETFCEDCGTIISDEIFDSRGKRAYTYEDYFSRSQHGPPENLRFPDKGLSAGKQPNLKILHLPNRANFTTKREKSLRFLLSENARLTSELNLSDDVKNEAGYLIQKLVKKTQLRGLRLEYVSGAAVFLAAKQLRKPRTMKEIKDKVKCQSNRTFKHVLKRFKTILTFAPVFITAEEYIPRFVSNLGMGFACEQLSKLKLKEMNLNRGTSKVQAAAAIYLVLHEQEGKKVVQKYVAEKCGISPPGLGQLLKHLTV